MWLKFLNFINKKAFSEVLICEFLLGMIIRFRVNEGPLLFVVLAHGSID